MAQTDKQKIGELGEDQACMFLKKHCYTINQRNYRKPWGEIDIIAQKDGTIHFMEVKTVVRENLAQVLHETENYEPEDNLHPWKLKRLSKAIQTYLLEKKIDEEEIDWQLDALSVYLNQTGELLKIDFLEDIF